MTRALFLLPLIAATVGCVDRQAMYREVTQLRDEARDDWQRHRADEAHDQAFLRGNLNLADAIKLALLGNKQLHVVLAERERARGVVQESHAVALPQVSATADYTHLNEAPTAGGVPFGQRDNYGFGLQVYQPLYKGGAIGAALRGAAVYEMLTDEQVRGAIQRTVFAVCRQYYDALLAAELCRVNREALESATATLDEVRKQRAQDVAREFDVLRAEVEVANSRTALLQQEHALRLARLALLRTMGASQNSQIELTQPLAYHPFEAGLDTAVGQAYRLRSELLGGELSIRLQTEALLQARSRYLPEVGVQLSQDWGRPDPRDSTRPEWSDARSGTLVVTYPLFDGLAREGKVTQRRAELRKAQLQLLDCQEAVIFEIERALTALANADEVVATQALNLDRARRGLQLAEAGYREGVTSQLQVIDARTALSRAEGLHFQAVHDHTVACLDYQLAVGLLGPPPATPTEPPTLDPRTMHVPGLDLATEGLAK